MALTLRQIGSKRLLTFAHRSVLLLLLGQKLLLPLKELLLRVDREIGGFGWGDAESETAAASIGTTVAVGELLAFTEGEPAS